VERRLSSRTRFQTFVIDRCPLGRTSGVKGNQQIYDYIIFFDLMVLAAAAVELQIGGTTSCRQKYFSPGLNLQSFA
jgi:hypothetical protein